MRDRVLHSDQLLRTMERSQRGPWAEWLIPLRPQKAGPRLPTADHGAKFRTQGKQRHHGISLGLIFDGQGGYDIRKHGHCLFCRLFNTYAYLLLLISLISHYIIQVLLEGSKWRGISENKIK